MVQQESHCSDMEWISQGCAPHVLGLSAALFILWAPCATWLLRSLWGIPSKLHVQMPCRAADHPFGLQSCTWRHRCKVGTWTRRLSTVPSLLPWWKPNLQVPKAAFCGGCTEWKSADASSGTPQPQATGRHPQTPSPRVPGAPHTWPWYRVPPLSSSPLPLVVA